MKKNESVIMLPGAYGIREAYERALTERRLDIVCFSEKYAEVIGDYFDASFAPRLRSSDICVREIIPDTQKNRSSYKDNRKQGKEVRLLKTASSSESDVIVGESGVILISFQIESPYALIIENSQLVPSFVNQFEGLWSSLG